MSANTSSRNYSDSNEKSTSDRERLEYLGLLAGGVAHRLGSRSGLIRLYVIDLRRLIPQENKEAHLLLDKIEQNVDYLADLSDALFIPAQATDTPAGLVDVNELIERAIDKADLPSDINLVKREGNVPNIIGNDWLVEVFTELITNAVKAITKNQNGKIIIKSQTNRKNNVAVIVEDNGHGIDPKELPKVFELLYQTENAPHLSHFGLWYSKNIVTSLGGDIQIESELGKGTKVTVRFPVARKGDRDGS